MENVDSRIAEMIGVGNDDATLQHIHFVRNVLESAGVNYNTQEDIWIRVLCEVLSNYFSDENFIDTSRLGIEQLAQPQKATKEMMMSLKPYQKIKKNDSLIKDKEMCCICYESYKVCEFKRQLPCEHVFHKRCVDKWLSKQNCVCPVCRDNPFKNCKLL